MVITQQRARSDRYAGTLRTVGDLMRGVTTCLFTTVGDHGPISRPMYLTGQADFDGTLWFFTYASSRKVRDVARTPGVSLGLALPDDGQWLSVCGTAALVRDRAQNDARWRGFLTAYFPGGTHDPDVALLRVSVHGAELWDGQKPIATRAFELVTRFGTRAPVQPPADVSLDLTADRAPRSPLST